MNIVSIINKLKETNMLSNTEEGIALFSECFNKFGISLLLLKDESAFFNIIDLLVENKIPLQKSNGIYNLRIFALGEQELKSIISAFSEINELNFLRIYPEMMTHCEDIKVILENMKKYQKDNILYKSGNEYDMETLLKKEDNFSFLNSSTDSSDVNEYIKSLLKDKSLIDKIENNIANLEEEDFNIALELQKIENKICEEFLFPAENGWKIVIDEKEVNDFQNVKDTINKIIELNIPVEYSDALIFVLFYKTNLNVSEIEQVLKNELFEGEMQ